eukprot:3235803-Lingulodinium_polyedra.AAC.1
MPQLQPARAASGLSARAGPGNTTFTRIMVGPAAGPASQDIVGRRCSGLRRFGPVRGPRH